MNRRFPPLAATILAAGLVLSAMAKPIVSDVTARQRYPWNNLVDIDYTISGVENAEGLCVRVMAEDRKTGVRHIAKTWKVSPSAQEGTHRATWDVEKDVPLFVADEVVYTVSLCHQRYMVIDLSRGEGAASYPVSYMDAPPADGWSDEYKKTKLVLRRIPAGIFTMGSPPDEPGRFEDLPETCHQVTLTTDYYMGVFEFTQWQWKMVTGQFNEDGYGGPNGPRSGPERPKEYITFNEIRGGNKGAQWPASREVDADSLLGKLRTKTGLELLDLPTEAQWERACRAGTTTGLNSGKELTVQSDYLNDRCPNMAEVGRYAGNSSKSGFCDNLGGYEEHTKVGSYLPNAWGLYDMHGNVEEYCLDFLSDDMASTPVVDPVGPPTGTIRIVRGGSWKASAQQCRSAFRRYAFDRSAINTTGFRLCLGTTSERSGHEVESPYEPGDLLLVSASSAPVRTDIQPGVRKVLPSTEIALAYSDRWNGTPGATAEIKADGTTIFSGTGEGIASWTTPATSGTVTLTHSYRGEDATAEIIVWSPAVKDVSARQRYPWNNLVDIRYTVEDVSNAEGLRARIEAKDRKTGRSHAVKTFVAEEVPSAGNGTCSLTWDADADLGDETLSSSEVVYSVHVEKVVGEAAAPVASGDSEPVPADIVRGPRYVAPSARVGLVYSDAWDGTDGGTVEIVADGQTLFSGTDDGVHEWTAPAESKRILLTHKDGATELDAVLLVEGTHLLAVSSDRGGVLPPAGDYVRRIGTEMTASAPATSPAGAGKRFACTGWSGTGSVPPSGNGTNTTFTLYEDSTLTWNWAAERLVSVDVMGQGTVTMSDGKPLSDWRRLDAKVTATAVAEAGGSFAEWTGDTDGCTVDGTTIEIPVDRPRAIRARFQVEGPLGNARVSELGARQRYPWNNLVDIDYVVSGVNDASDLFVRVEAEDRATGRRYVAETFVGATPEASNGRHRATWAPEKDGVRLTSSDVVFTATLCKGRSRFLVVDLSAGKNAESYPVSRLHYMPADGWGEEYKTRKAVLRRIPAGTFTMGSPADELGRVDYDFFETLHQVTLTRDFYIGVFEFTQGQWEMVTGEYDGDGYGTFPGRDRPKDRVSYNEIRGQGEGAKWPESPSVDAGSFLGRLRTKTGLETLDLPTEAEWEYACRAGTTTALNSGKNLSVIGFQKYCPNMDEVGRYCGNSGVESDGRGGYAQHTEVGCYLPNAWGLYDMHGNVEELCLDWLQPDLGTDHATDPKGPKGDQVGQKLRTCRGGYWSTVQGNCRSAYRWSNTQPNSKYEYTGFRLAVRDLEPMEVIPLWAASSDPIRLEIVEGKRSVAAGASVPLVYSDAWDGAGGGGSVTIAADGATLKTVTGQGVFLWTAPTTPGEITLTHTEGETVFTAVILVKGSAATATSTTPVPVPYAWLDGFRLVVDGDYEAAAWADGKNGRPVWESYVLGLDPTNSTSRFIASIRIEGGEAVVTWTPSLDGRRYTVLGKKELSDEDWAPRTDAHRFFLIEVELEP